MRIPQTWLPIMAKEIIKSLIARKLVECNESEDHVISMLQEIMLQELMVEDTLNDEVREMLQQYDAEIEKGHLDYRSLFEMTKKKLIRDRNIIV
ncbi:MAG: DUF507 family protein [Nitrospira sp.]|nr:DUF507 family protein [bacterium]MBL7048304.1 DUF507 family protein [Nitrospira sp.]